jgi:hypothetical protein
MEDVLCKCIDYLSIEDVLFLKQVDVYFYNIVEKYNIITRKIKKILNKHLENRVKPEEWSRDTYDHEHGYESGIVSYIVVTLKINDYKTYSISKNVNFRGSFPYINVGQIDCTIMCNKPDPKDNHFMFYTITKFVNMTTGEIKS